MVAAESVAIWKNRKNFCFKNTVIINVKRTKEKEEFSEMFWLWFPGTMGQLKHGSSRVRADIPILVMSIDILEVEIKWIPASLGPTEQSNCPFLGVRSEHGIVRYNWIDYVMLFPPTRKTRNINRNQKFVIRSLHLVLGRMRCICIGNSTTCSSIWK